MQARVSVSKEASAKSAAKPAHAPKTSEYFAAEEQTQEPSTPGKFSWSFGDIRLSAPGDSGAAPPENGGQKGWASRRPGFPPPLPIQAKLEVGAVDDPLEREADGVAEQVMRMPEPAAPPQKPDAHVAMSAFVSSPASAASNAPVKAPPIVHEVLRSPGQPLDAATRTLMESCFDSDFSGVRIHTDARAAESARAARARAYTVGHDVVFGANHYAPSSAGGRELLAHELAHTIQQRNASGPPPSPEPHGIVELSARAAGREVARGERVSRELPSSGIGLSRSPDSPELSAEDRKELEAKLASLAGPAKDIYLHDIEPVLVKVVPKSVVDDTERFVRKVARKEHEEYEHRRYLTTAYFERRLYSDYALKDAYEHALQLLLKGDDSLDYGTMEEIVQQNASTAPWHEKARQEFLAKRRAQEQEKEARHQAREQAHERKRLLPKMPDYWQNQMGSLSEQIQGWPEEAQYLAQGLLWKWYELRKQAFPSNPALAIPGVETGIEASIRKDLVAQFEQVLRAADQTIQEECSKNPPYWMAKIHGDPCVSLFAPAGRAESALAHFERRMKIFRDEDAVPYRTVFFWVQEYMKQQVPTSMAGRYLELLQARSQLVGAFNLASFGAKPTPLTGAVGEASVGGAALGEASLGEISAGKAPTTVGSAPDPLTFPRTDLTQGRAFAPPEIEPLASAPPSARPTAAGAESAEQASGISGWLRSKLLEYAIRGAEASEVTPRIGAGAPSGGGPVATNVAGPAPRSAPSPDPVTTPAVSTRAVSAPATETAPATSAAQQPTGPQAPDTQPASNTPANPSAQPLRDTTQPTHPAATSRQSTSNPTESPNSVHDQTPAVEIRTPRTPDYGTPAASATPRAVSTRPMKRLPQGASRGSMGDVAGTPVAHPQSSPTVEVRTQTTPDYGKPEYSVRPQSQGPDPWAAPPQPTNPPAPRAARGHHQATGQGANQAQALVDLQKGRVGMQEHRTAPAARAALGQVGQDVESTHLVPQAVYKAMNASPEIARTVNFPKAVNTAIDRFWKPMWAAATKLGTPVTGRDIRNLVSKGIRNVPDSVLPQLAKNTLEWSLDMELKELGITDETIIRPGVQ